MTHILKLQEQPFRKIQEGTKTIESRLFDEKRQQIQLGDHMIFKLATDVEQTVTTNVVGLLRYPDFATMMTDLPPDMFGWDKAEDAINEINQFYSIEDQHKFGVLGIRIESV